MFFDIEDKTLNIENAHMDYISFGKKGKNLILLPGLGDGLRTVKGLGASLAFSYRKLIPHYKVYVFSRRNPLKNGCSTKDMAVDVALAMEHLGVKSAYVVGVSLGGMIAQHLASLHPEKVNKLVLAVTLARNNESSTNVVTRWMEMAKEQDYKGLFIDTAENSYSEAYLKKVRPLYGALSFAARPKDLERFLAMASATISHDSFTELKNIKCPTLVLGAENDKIVTPQASREIHEHLPQSELFLYPGLGHGCYDEAKDFLKRVMDFFEKAD